jgi:hypothetical protein
VPGLEESQYRIYEAGVGVKQKRKSFACAAKPV